MIPVGLDEMEPGPNLAAILSEIDVNQLSGHDRIVVLKADQRMASHYNARVYEDMAAVSDYMDEIDDDPELAWLSAAAEIRAALRLTRRTADNELGYALELKDRLPRVWEALAAGDIDPWRAKTIARGTGHLPVETAREVVDQIIEVAPGLTTGQLKARIRRLSMEADPDDAKERYEDAVANRRMVSEPTESGTAHLFGLDLPPHRVAAVTRKINRLAKALKSEGESRTMDQLRADVFLDILHGNGHHRETRGQVDIQTDLETLMGLAEQPGELAGFGPVIADIARQVTELQVEAHWRWTVTNRDTGQPLFHGTTRRRPAAAQRRAVETRDRTCVFPGCRMPASECDLDHRIPWSEGGPTTVRHLAPACRHDHVVRHKAGWTYRPLRNGDYVWTSRLGHTYTTSGLPP